jgi:hypothetical protein
MSTVISPSIGQPRARAGVRAGERLLEVNEARRGVLD